MIWGSAPLMVSLMDLMCSLRSDLASLSPSKPRTVMSFPSLLEAVSYTHLTLPTKRIV